MTAIKDIESTSARLLDRLTLQEKTLVENLIKFRHYDTKNLVGRYRAPVVQLDAAIAWLIESSKAGADVMGNLAIYCDVLVCNDTAVVGGTRPLSISVFARQIIHRKTSVQSDDTPAIRFSVVKNSVLTIWAQELPFPFIVDFVSGSDDAQVIQRQQFVLFGKASGFAVVFDGSNTKPRTKEFPNVDLNTESWLSSLDSGVALNEVPFSSDNIARMLQFQYLAAASQVYENPKFALRLLNWVCAATARKAESIINHQARSLRNSLTLNVIFDTEDGHPNILPSLPSYVVPSLNVQSCKQSLLARLQAAARFEQCVQDLLFREQNAVNWSTLGNELVKASDDAQKEYFSQQQTAMTDYDDAVTACAIAETNFKATEAVVTAESQKFKAAVDRWKSDVRIAAANEILLSVISVGSAVATTVATYGAATGSIANICTQVVSGTPQSKATWEQVNKVVEELKVIYIELELTLKALGRILNSVKNTMAFRRDFELKTLVQNLRGPHLSLDDLDAIAQWRCFVLQVEMLEEALIPLEIEGTDTYFLALVALTRRGQTFIQAQTEVISRGDELAVITLRLREEEEARLALERLITCFGDNAHVSQLLGIAMFDRLLAVRASVCVNLYNYASAYMFHTLTPTPPIVLSPVKPIAYYSSDARTLQMAVAEFDSRRCVRRKRFLLPFDAEQAADMVQKLTSEIKIEFEIAPDHPAFKGVCRVRLSRARLSFKGLVTYTENSLRLALSTSKEFFDIAFPDENAGGGPRETSSLIRRFRGQSRRVIHEQHLDSGEVSRGGDFDLKSDSVMLTPFTTWSIELAEGGMLARDIDPTSGASASLELVCEVCFIN